MVLAGAKGDTKRQILDALNLSEKSDEDILTGFSALIGKTEVDHIFYIFLCSILLFIAILLIPLILNPFDPLCSL